MGEGVITADFETRSPVDLRKMGAMRYATDPQTQVLCLCWLYDDEDEVHLWHRGHSWTEKSSRPDELIERIAAGELFEAHNAKFEFVVWNHVLRREFPEFDVELQIEQMRCSAAKASCLSLRRQLGDAANDIGLTERKDTDGKRLIQKLSKPMARRTEVEWCEEEIEHRRNWEYCAQDVRAERALSKWCGECMTPRELEFWFMDFRMNMRGVRLDKEAAEGAIRLCSLEVDRLNGEMQQITGGRVLGGAKRIPFRAWANERLAEIGAEPIPDTRADTLSFRLYGVPTKAGEEAKLARKDEMEAEWASYGPTAEPIKRAFEICLEVNRSSVAKFKRMIGGVCPDGRLHDVLLYNGADRPVSGDAEVLTRQGWFKIEDWTGGEIAQWDIGGRIVFGAAERRAFSYDGDMIHIKGRFADLFCTPEHKIPTIVQEKRWTTAGALRDERAEDLKRNVSRALPLAGVFNAVFESPDITRACCNVPGGRDCLT